MISPRRHLLAAVAACALLASTATSTHALSIAWGGFEGTTTFRGIDGYLRQSGTVNVPAGAVHAVWINLCTTGCAQWAQTGTYQGEFSGGSSRDQVHIFYENVNACGDYSSGDKGAPPNPNYPYYISYDGAGQVTLPCLNGGHVLAYRFPFRKGSFASNPFVTGYLSSASALPFAKTEIQNSPPLGTDYLGCEAAGGVCFNASYGLHVLTSNSMWVLWTGPATPVTGNPPFVHKYNDYWSFATCPTSC